MTHTLSRGAAALALAAALAACGGGGGGGGGDAAGGPTAGGVDAAMPPPGPTTPSTAAVPDTAFGSWPAMLAFLKALVADETGEPLAVPGPAAPLDDGGEPSPAS